MTLKITAAMIKRHGACEVPDSFTEKWPKGTEVTTELVRWCAEHDYLDWGLHYLFSLRTLDNTARAVVRVALTNQTFLPKDLNPFMAHPLAWDDIDWRHQNIPYGLREGLRCFHNVFDDPFLSTDDKREAYANGLRYLFSVTEPYHLELESVMVACLRGEEPPKKEEPCANCDQPVSVYTATKLVLGKKTATGTFETLEELILCTECANGGGASLTKIAVLSMG